MARGGDAPSLDSGNFLHRAKPHKSKNQIISLFHKFKIYKLYIKIKKDTFLENVFIVMFDMLIIGGNELFYGATILPPEILYRLHQD